MSPPTQGRGAPSTVAATLKYLIDSEETPVYHASVGGGDTNRYDGRFEDRSVVIRNGRDLIDRFSLDRQGFILVRHDTDVSDFYEESQITNVYEPEIERLIAELTGARRVFVFDHTFRSDAQAIREERKVRDPVPLVHNDYTARSARRRVRDLLPAGEVDDLLRNRFAIINVWRSVKGSVQTTPLAVCDARSVSDSNLVAVERRARDRIGEMQQATFDSNHRWYFFPDMERDEALVFKTYDSAADGRARRSLHAAFDSPIAPPTAGPRESIETRAFAFFEEPPSAAAAI